MGNVQEEKFSNKNIVQLLRSISATYLLTNENRFKIIAYQRAADSVGQLSRELKSLWQDGKIRDVEGIGPSIASHLDEYFKIGRSKHFDSVLKKIPSTVFELMKIPTLGPKKAFKLVTSLRLANTKTLITDLKKACNEDKIAKLPTFGAKSQEDIKEAIALFEKRSVKEDRMPLPYAYSISSDLIKYLKKNPKVKKTDALGSLRRMVSTIGDVDIAVEADEEDADAIINYFTNYPRRLSIDNKGTKKASIIVSPNVRVDLRVTDTKSYGSMLQYFTGSKIHNIKLREYALKKGYSLSEYGIKEVKSQIPNLKSQKSILHEFETEEKFYKFLGLQYIPPEIREGTEEIEKADKKSLPKLVELKDIKADLHLHSSYNLKPSHDAGVNSYIEIAKKAKTLEYDYVGFADHNPSISNNTENEIIAIMKRRKDYIDHIFSTLKVEQSKYFIGLEVDILPTGKIALPQEAIKYLDYLLVSIHSGFQMSKEDMTKRVLNALSNPKVKIFGHPTGRLLGKREGVDLNWQEVFDYCKQKSIAIEVNAWPERLDLPDALVKDAVKAGVKLILNSDAHATLQMDNMFYAVSVARRGWAKKNDIMNTLGYEEFKKWLLS